ncbi:40S ribosomal protein S24 isoform X1 [Pristis pectinata]|uniref:40S ribosomal protein S24 isoform X1 n=1 Tax=Pristis pectinata TaxID=685728 RepID=UPI00223D2409|nr:40S ribosomal protein S24 isoform X1 [Pristis pectinata]
MDRDRCREDKRSFNWGRANYEAIRRELGSVNWYVLFEGKCTMELWLMFRDLMQDVRDKYVPVRQRRNGRVKEPWVTREVERLVRKKKVAYMRYKQQGSDRACEEYRVARKELKKGLRRARRGHEKALASRVKENPKAFFTYVKGRRMARVKVGPIKGKGGRMRLEAAEVGEVLNEYFSLVFTEEGVLDDVEGSAGKGNVLEVVDIKIEDVLKLLTNIKTDNSPGPDGIFPRLLREAREEMVEPLVRIFESSLSMGMVPGEWRVANVVPLFKKGNRDSPGNYRPVSLTSVVGKLLERILRDRIYEHPENRGLIRDSQHGFVKGRSCLSSLIRVL